MLEDRDLYDRVTQIRADAFELIAQLSTGVDGEDDDPMRTLALVRMQAVANSLGRIQGDLRGDRDEPLLRRESPDL